MQSFQDPVSKLFCVTFDNSSVKDKFYSSIKSLNETILNTIFEKYINQKIKIKENSNLIEPNFNLSLNYYLVGDGVKLEYTQNQTNNRTKKENKFYFFNAHTSGECVRNEPLKFMKNIPERRCSKKFVMINKI